MAGDSNKLAVYPRWRGEHANLPDMCLKKDGLSPLARGTLRAFIRSVQRKRFIPAGAGNTSAHSRYFSFTPVYPRWRGEHFRLCASSVISVGLSPLARGTLARTRNRRCSDRFIPAGAGNTSLAALVVLSYSVYPRWRGEHNSCPAL